MAVFGKAMTSRIDCVLHKMDIIRSKPVGQQRVGYKMMHEGAAFCFNERIWLTQSNAAMRRCATSQRVQKLIEWGFLRFAELVKEKEDTKGLERYGKF